MKVGFVGLGLMGQPMTGRLVDAGHDVVVYNHSVAAIELAAKRGARPAASAAEVADKSEIIMTALPTPASVEAVYRDMLDERRDGRIFVDHSTVTPALNQSCAALALDQGAGFLDAPVSGGPTGAEAGTLTVMVGGDADVLGRARPALEAYGSKICHCGSTGSGQVLKLVNQLLVAIHTSAAAEAAVFGQALGADPDTLLEVIGSSFGGSTMLVRNLPRFMARNFKAATTCDLILKDLGLVHDEARAAGVPLLFGALAEQIFVTAHGRDLGRFDMARVVQLWEGPAGVEVVRPIGANA